ncbi:Na+/H+ antiporter NhaA [bacterium AH-315-J21]|nr:Na+/H+ antiporter NhaA [bacterium AH-315-J21]
MNSNIEQQLRPVQRLTKPLRRFLHIEASGGMVLLGATIAALLIANSPFAETYHGFWNQLFGVSMGGAEISYPLWYWVNDGLMVIFFFVIGLELKRELTTGELSQKRKIILPAVAAIGGAAIPALIFLALQQGEPSQVGWAIPMATDIAFVVGILSLLGKRVPHGLKIFLLSVAIVDDLLAVSVIAIFFTESIHLFWLALSVGGFGVIVLLKKIGVRSVPVYTIVGCAIWFFTLKSGVHPTIAGVILGLLTPATSFLERMSARKTLVTIGETTAEADEKKARKAQFTLAQAALFTARESVSPLERLETMLHPWVAFLIMPVFALANAAVTLNVSSFGESLSIAVILGLVAGKPIGILLSSFLVIAVGWASLPEKVGWLTMIGAGALAGIGFTMSLFIASLALDGTLLETAKGGVLIGSGISMLLGFGILMLSLKKPEQ